MCQERYTVGLVSALPKELYAVRALFDHRHQDPVGLDPHDTNSYVFGRIGHHDVVAACLPQGEYGTNSAADVATNMSRSFPALQFCLLIGRGGGVPSPENDVRLGDVVVSLPTDTHPGVIQYDLGKATADDTFKATGLLTRPPRVLTEAIINLTSDDTLPPDFLRVFMQQVATRNSSYHSPGLENDVLHQSDTIHEVSYDKGSGGYDCPLAERSERRSDYPRIFYGIIGSGNQVVKSSRIRDQLGERYHILCLEMEAAGVMNTIPCLVIRGICDYADAHKNKIWQEYAAAAAAAYAKVLLSYFKGLSNVKSPRILLNSIPAQYCLSGTDKPPSISLTALAAAASSTGHCLAQKVKFQITEHWGRITPPESESIMRHALARRRQFWNPWPKNLPTILHSLQVWAGAASGSTLLVCQTASAIAHPRAVDLAMELTNFLRSTTPYTVIHGLCSTPVHPQTNIVSILESLISQCFRAGAIPQSIDILPDRNDTSDREEALWELFSTALAQVDGCFLVAEGTGTNGTEKLVAVLSEIIQHRYTSKAIKAMIVACAGYQVPRSAWYEGDRLITIQIPASPTRRKPGMAKGRAPQWKRLKPSLASQQ